MTMVSLSNVIVAQIQRETYLYIVSLCHTHSSHAGSAQPLAHPPMQLEESLAQWFSFGTVTLGEKKTHLQRKEKYIVCKYAGGKAYEYLIFKSVEQKIKIMPPSSGDLLMKSG